MTLVLQLVLMVLVVLLLQPLSRFRAVGPIVYAPLTVLIIVYNYASVVIVALL